MLAAMYSFLSWPLRVLTAGSRWAVRRVVRDLDRRRLLARTALERDRLRSLPAGTPGTSRLLDWTIDFVDGPSLASMFVFQVARGHNDFLSETNAPYILDCGANIGMSVLRYKQLYPAARIVAFEPHPALFSVLGRNLRQNGIEGVEALEAAVWTEDGSCSFVESGPEGGHLAAHSGNPGEIVASVATLRLARYLDRDVDLLKLDVEGAELEVLRDCEGGLARVKRMIVEVHHTVERPGFLGEVLCLLGRAGYRVSLEAVPDGIGLSTRYERPAGRGVDQHPVLCAWRTE